MMRNGRVQWFCRTYVSIVITFLSVLILNYIAMPVAILIGYSSGLIFSYFLFDEFKDEAQNKTIFVVLAEIIYLIAIGIALKVTHEYSIFWGGILGSVLLWSLINYYLVPISWVVLLYFLVCCVALILPFIYIYESNAIGYYFYIFPSWQLLVTLGLNIYKNKSHNYP